MNLVTGQNMIDKGKNLEFVLSHLRAIANYVPMIVILDLTQSESNEEIKYYHRRDILIQSYKYDWTKSDLI